MLDKLREASVAELKRMEIACLFTLDYCRKNPGNQEVIEQQEKLLVSLRGLLKEINKLLSDFSI